jgi:folate-dependent phosphoribosylglycinamide formyltransferase PurN
MIDRTRGGLVMLAGRSELGAIAYHALAGRLPIRRVLIEEPVSRAEFVRRRMTRLGFATAAGQIAFAACVVPVLRSLARRRIVELKRRFGFSDRPIPPEVVERVSSVNAPETIRLLKAMAPDVVLVNGTRILSRHVLERIPATFINMHAGITPEYRGVHGAYWALTASDAARCGVTVHLVDAGIDTGPIVSQVTFAPEREDSFVTYPYHQLFVGLPCLERAVRDALNGELTTRPRTGGASRCWSHPTAFQYLRYRALRGVR